MTREERIWKYADENWCSYEEAKEALFPMPEREYQRQLREQQEEQSLNNLIFGIAVELLRRNRNR